LPCETVVKVVGEFDSDVSHEAVPELERYRMKCSSDRIGSFLILGRRDHCLVFA
jgi:hypothetical protein